jgi:inorganic pyrophosphatase
MQGGSIYPKPGGSITRNRAIEGEQGDKKKPERNDRLVAVESGNHSYAHVKRIDDLGKNFEREIEEFFVNYHRLTGKDYRFLP